MGLDPNLVKVVKKKKPPLEKKVKEYLTRQVKGLAECIDVSYFIDWPPASQYGIQGRPDATVYIGQHTFMVEVKRDKGSGSLSSNQMHWIRRHNEEHSGKYGIPVYVAWGKSGVDEVIARMIVVIANREENEAMHGNSGRKLLPEN